ncbi:MAG: cytochrome P450 [Solirubrobacterales bacterium]|nr:cytochrome P450 [Solirubrobacterales bacterium]
MEVKEPQVAQPRPPTERPPKVRKPRAVQAWKLAHAQNSMFDEARAELGDVFELNLGRNKWNVLAHPDAIKQVFTSPPTVLHAGKGNEILATALGDHSVLLLDEDEHMRQRKLLLPSFHGEKLATQTKTIERIAELQVERIPRGETFSVREHSQEIALEVILEVVLGTASTGEQHDRLGAATKHMLEWIASGIRLVASQMLGPRSAAIKRMYRPVLKPLDAGLYELIAERMTEPGLEERDDILSMLLTARDEDGRPMTDVEIRDELVTLIVAGHETTATALAWTFERLTRTPGSAARLHEESLTDETEYTKAVAQEGLRLRPVLDFVIRKVVEPIEIAGYQFQPGDIVTPSIYLVHRREDVYPQALEFKPERWFDQKPGTYTWIPFGGGVRRCIGFSFAMAEMETVMRAVARAGVLESVGPDEKTVQRFITSSPERGGEVRFAA